MNKSDMQKIEYDKHLKKTGVYNGQNGVNIKTDKMKKKYSEFLSIE